MLRAGIVGLPNVGQVHALQRPHPDAQGGGRELPLLHDRAERRRRHGARRAPRAARDDLATTTKIVPTTIEFVDIAGLVQGRVEGGGARKQVPPAHPGGGRDRRGRALLREPRRRARRGGPRSAGRHRDGQDRAGARRPGDGRRAPATRRKRRRGAATGRRRRSSRWPRSSRAPGLRQARAHAGALSPRRRRSRGGSSS